HHLSRPSPQHHQIRRHHHFYRQRQNHRTRHPPRTNRQKGWLCKALSTATTNL
ncbi:hypothetical protein, partial [uncultured Gammaproteobacteria bacterium]